MPNRTKARLVLHLPIADSRYEGLVMDLVGALQDLRRSTFHIYDFVHSVPWPPAFRRYSWNPRGRNWESESQVQVLVDCASIQVAIDVLNQLRRRVIDAYEYLGSSLDPEFPAVIHEIVRL